MQKSQQQHLLSEPLKLTFACETVSGGMVNFATMSSGCCGLGAMFLFGFALFLGGRLRFGIGITFSCRSDRPSNMAIAGAMTTVVAVL